MCLAYASRLCLIANTELVCTCLIIFRHFEIFILFLHLEVNFWFCHEMSILFQSWLVRREIWLWLQFWLKLCWLCWWSRLHSLWSNLAFLLRSTEYILFNQTANVSGLKDVPWLAWSLVYFKSFRAECSLACFALDQSRRIPRLIC